MRTRIAKVNGKAVTIFVPETPEEAAELQRRAEAGEIGNTSEGKANQPGTMTRVQAHEAKGGKRPPPPKPSGKRAKHLPGEHDQSSHGSGGGGEGGARSDAEDARIDRELAQNRERNRARVDRREEVIAQSEDIMKLALQPDENDPIVGPIRNDPKLTVASGISQAAKAGDLTTVNSLLESADEAFRQSPEARKELDELAVPIMREWEANVDQYVPAEKVTHGEFTARDAAIARARELEDEISGRPRERAYTLDAYGNVIEDSEERGTYHSAPVGKFNGNPQGGVLVHNHPNSLSLSTADIAVGKKFGLIEIRAIGYNGDRYRMSPKLDRSGDPDIGWGHIEAAIPEYEARVRDEFTAKIQVNEMTTWEAQTRHQHEIYLRMARDGVMNYEYEPKRQARR